MIKKLFIEKSKIMSHSAKNIIEPVSIDCVIFGFEDQQLQVLLIKRAVDLYRGKWALPGGFILQNEDIDAASMRILKDMTGVSLYMEQLKAFGSVDRFPGKRVITIAYYALIKPKHFQLAPGEEATDAQWFPVRDVPSLPFDHGEILETALKTLKWKVRHQPIGFELLPEKFTLLQLQDLYQAILEKKLDKSNFRRKLKNIDVLTPLGEKQTGVAHRAAELYKFNIQRYQSLTKSGFVVEFV